MKKNKKTHQHAAAAGEFRIVKEPWRIGNAAVLHDESFHSFLSDSSLTVDQVQAGCLNVYNIVNDNGWLNTTAFTCLVDYSDERSRILVEQAPSGSGAEFWDAYQATVAPVPFGISRSGKSCSYGLQYLGGTWRSSHRS